VKTRNELIKWILALVIAFVLLKIGIFPLVKYATKSPTPLVTVMTNSMEHNQAFEEWWLSHKTPYLEKNITKQSFSNFPYKNGLNVGDLVFVINREPKNIKVGDVLIFETNNNEIIIHRVVHKWVEDKQYIGPTYLFQTKGDNHYISIKDYYLDEYRIPKERIKGIAAFRIHYLGYPKVLVYNIAASLSD
jgi:signal peptidase I